MQRAIKRVSINMNPRSPHRAVRRPTYPWAFYLCLVRLRLRRCVQIRPYIVSRGRGRGEGGLRESRRIKRENRGRFQNCYNKAGGKPYAGHCRCAANRISLFSRTVVTMAVRGRSRTFRRIHYGRTYFTSGVYVRNGKYLFIPIFLPFSTCVLRTILDAAFSYAHRFYGVAL